ncbi:MAG TPA: site-2 protease family protein [Bryobacteraceae bacterium]|nr:site-2 protease family protein [Bryobacteraceae bacterium]
MDPDTLALGPLWYVAFLLSTTCHEASHALAAKLGGDPTAFHEGQVSLNPMPHIRREPFGMVLMPLLSFLTGGAMIGWASAPYDPYWQQRHPRRAAWMSLAGPAANLAIVIVAAILIRSGIAAGVFRPLPSISFTHVVSGNGAALVDGGAVLLSIFFALNLLLACFNLLPVPPLDGYTALGVFTSERVALRLIDFARSAGAFALLGIVIAWYALDYVFDPVFIGALRLLYTGLLPV